MKSQIRIYLYVVTTVCTGVLHAQSPASVLDRVISLNIHRKPLAQALDSIGQKGHFEFSYNSSILRGDSVISLTLKQVTVRQMLERLLGQRYTYTERGHYLIILRATEERAPPESIYQLTGYVVDGRTGKRVAHASVYEKEQLQSVLTDEQGFFRLRLKTRYNNPVLTVSKEWYTDTAMTVRPGYDQVFTIAIIPVPVTELSPVFIAPSRVERTRWGRFFLSSRQRIQSLNLSHFFTDKPYQLSLTPGLGTHGRLSGQVINTVSVNMIGGYSAGTKGFEAGGVFNIDKNNVRYLQAAGAFNLVGGKVVGVQAAGVSNTAMDSVTGLQTSGVVDYAKGVMRGGQVAGVANAAGDNVAGVQAAGVVNVARGDVRGAQISGVANIARGKVNGFQVSGILNITRDTLRGIQVSDFFNQASVLRGVQIGFVNISDTSSGYSIGLVNIVKRGGIRELSLSMEDITGLTLAFKSGNRKLYDILLVGYDPWFSEHLISFGFGLGKSFSFGRGWGLSTELTTRQLYDDRWNSMGTMYRLQPALTFRWSKWVSCYVGPTFSLHIYDKDTPAGVSKADLPGTGYPATYWGGRSSAWIGAAFGISFR